MNKVVGVTIGTKSEQTKNKIYYYTTEKDLKKGDLINIKVNTGGTPIAKVMIQNSHKKFNRKLKELNVVQKSSND